MDNSNLNKQLVINNIQEFAELVGNYDQAWKLLVGKKVSRIREEVKYKGKKTGIKGSKNYKYGQIINIKYENDTVYVHIKYQHNFFAEYKIDKIINQFSDIFPFITVKEIFQKVPEIKNKILQETYQKLEQDLLNVNKFYQERLYKYLTKEEFWQEKHRFVQSWLEKNLGRKPDLEQSVALGEVNNNIQEWQNQHISQQSFIFAKTLWYFTKGNINTSFQPLFYVALTRAIKQLYIITESPNYSPFLAHLNLNKINWQEYPILGDKSKYISSRT